MSAYLLRLEALPMFGMLIIKFLFQSCKLRLAYSWPGSDKGTVSVYNVLYTAPSTQSTVLIV